MAYNLPRRRRVVITDHDRIAQALQESEEKYRTLVEASLDSIFIEDMDGKVLDCNGVALATYGYTRSEMLGLDAGRLVTRDVRERLPRIIAATRREGSMYVEASGVRKDGSVFPTEVSIKLANLGRERVAIIYVRDITERTKYEAERAVLQAQLLHSQKLEALGMLSSAISHEINNPVQVIMNYARIIQKGVDASSPLREYADEILGESTHVAEIIRHLLNFARPQRTQARQERVDALFESSLLLFRTSLVNDGITVDFETDEDLPAVTCSRQQMQQLFINLLSNARDALRERWGEVRGEKTIRVCFHVLEDDEGSWLRTVVEDNGAGIEPDVAGKVFEPFFSTKPKDEGTGLGLTVSRSIVEEQGGRMNVESEKASHTRFLVDLPIE